MSELFTRDKTPSEEIPLVINYRNQFRKAMANETIQNTSSVSIFDNITGEDVTATMLKGTVTLSDTKIQAIIKGGDIGKTYRVVFSAKTQNFLIQDTVLVTVTLT